MKNKLTRAANGKRYKKRVIRYGLLVGNLSVVAIAIAFVLYNPDSQVIKQNVANVGDTQAINPLDTLSSADIAVNASRMTGLAESNSVTNQADSVAAEINTQVVEYAVVPKPQILSSVIKTKADINDYTVKEGDTLSDLANKFGVTSDSIKWTNGIVGNLRPGVGIAIPPIDGIVYTVKSGDTAESIATKYAANKDQIIAFNDAEVSGLKVGERIVVPGGTIAPPPVTTNYFSAGAVSARYGNNNGYDYGWCTWYVSNRRSELGRSVPNNLGNAYTWYTISQRAGLPVGTTPQIGAVMVLYYGPSSPANHVSVVEQINEDGSFWVSEMNAGGQRSITDSTSAGGWGRISFKLYSNAGNSKFIY